MVIFISIIAIVALVYSINSFISIFQESKKAYRQEYKGVLYINLCIFMLCLFFILAWFNVIPDNISSGSFLYGSI